MSSASLSHDNSWMPAAGKHPVDIGSSLRSALKGSKPPATSNKRSLLPSRDFYSVRYRFKPPSLDSTKPGYISITPRAEDIAATVEHPCEQSTDVHTYVGTEIVAKDVDCILIYDEETMTFTLEKLDSSINLSYDKKGPATIQRPVASHESVTPPVVSAPDTPPSRPSARKTLPPKPSAPESPPPPSSDTFEMELAEALGFGEEVEETPARSAPPPPKPRPEPVPRKAQRSELSSSTSKGKAKAAQQPPAPAPPPPPPPQYDDDDDEEIFEIAAPPAKKARHSPVPEKRAPASSGLALPGSSFGGIALPTSSHAVNLPSAPSPPSPSPPPAPSIPIEVDGSDSEEDWDEVPAVGGDPVALTPSQDIDSMEEELIGQMTEDMAVITEVDFDDDFLRDEVEAELEQDSPVISRQPKSLDELADEEFRAPREEPEADAGLFDPDPDQDEYSSSDESDEE